MIANTMITGTKYLASLKLGRVTISRIDLLLTSPITLNKQVLVQRKESGENGENDSLYIRNQLDLAGRTLHVVKGSPSILRIQNLGNEI